MKLLENNKELLETIFIVSKVELSYEKPAADAFTETESGIAVSVGNADGEKCVRCWTYFDNVFHDEQGQPICSRCKSVTC